MEVSSFKLEVSSGEATEVVAEMQVRALVERAAQFCKLKGGSCYEGYSLNDARDYLLWHAGNDTLRIVQTFGRVAAVGVAWRARRVDLREDGDKWNPFKWQRERGTEDVIFIAQVVATETAALADLMTSFRLRFPDCETTPVFTYRYKQLTPLTPKWLRRVGRGGESGMQNKRF